MEKLKAKESELENKMQDPKIWEKPEIGGRMGRELAKVRNEIGEFESLKSDLEDMEEMISIGEVSDDMDFIVEIDEEMSSLSERLSKLEEEILLSGEEDHRNAIVAIHPGAGGIDAQDWAEMLLRMYLRWCEARSFKTEMVDTLQGDGGGIKSATFEVKGNNAYGLLAAEEGVHRLVRISPFDASRRRHTSFASVDVMCEAIEEEIAIDPKDLRIETYRSSGAGGQHVNVTDSAVRMTHLPTGVVVQCQNDRSQTLNKQAAMRLMRARLNEVRLKEISDERNRQWEDRPDIDFGSQIRSYVLHPYRMVKDHRTNAETGNVDSVLDGNISPFIDAYLLMKARESRERKI